MENYDFKSTKYWSQSLLQKFLGCAADVKVAIEAPNKPTAAMIEGTHFHYLMEGGKDYIVYDENLRPEKDKDFRNPDNKKWRDSLISDAESNGEYLINPNIFKMVEALKQSEIYKRLMQIPLIGQEKFYKTIINGVGLKIKPDYLTLSKDEKIVFIIDWKKTSDNLTTNPYQLARIIRKYNLHFQGCQYTEVLREIMKKEVVFCLVFVQDSEPYNIVPVLLQKGQPLYEEAYIDWMLCLEQAKNFNPENPEKLDEKIKRLNNDLFIKL